MTLLWSYYGLREINKIESTFEVIFENSVGVWALQQKKMCLRGSKRGRGTFKIRKSGHLDAIKLVFSSKFVSCACNKLKIGQCDASKLRVIITNQRKSVYFPGFLGKKYVYKNKAYKEGSNALVIDDPSRDGFFVKRRQRMKAFMGNLVKNLKGCGVPCPKVYAHIRSMYCIVLVFKVLVWIQIDKNANERQCSVKLVVKIFSLRRYYYRHLF